MANEPSAANDSGRAEWCSPEAGRRGLKSSGMPGPDAAYERRWTHRDLIEGKCSVPQYVADIKADVDARLAAEKVARLDRYKRAHEAQRKLSRARRLLRRLV